MLLRGNLAVLYDAVEQAEKQKKQKLITGMSHDLKSPPDLYPGLKRGPAGGQVRAENGPEGGLRIVFTLPIAKEDAYA